MNKHLKPGVAVDVRGASDEDVQAVIDACVELGAIHCVGIGNKFVKWAPNGCVWVSPSCSDMNNDNMPVISISQALGRESEVENTWFERGELPPVGAKVKLSCPEFDRDHDFEFDGTEAEILLHRTTDNGNKVAVFVSEHGDYHALVAHCFRPLKTEKEKFVERAREIFEDYAPPLNYEKLYDKGLRFTE